MRVEAGVKSWKGRWDYDIGIIILEVAGRRVVFSSRETNGIVKSGRLNSPGVGWVAGRVEDMGVFIF